MKKKPVLHHLLCLVVGQLYRVVASLVRVVARGLVRTQVNQQLPGPLELQGESLPQEDDVAVEPDTRHLQRNVNNRRDPRGCNTVVMLQLGPGT